MSAVDQFNDGCRRIRRAARDLPHSYSEHWDIIDRAVTDLARAYVTRTSELLAAYTAEVERRRNAEHDLDLMRDAARLWAEAYHAATQGPTMNTQENSHAV